MIFRFELPTTILFGVGGVNQIGEEAVKLGHKAMIVTYPDIRRIGLLDRVVNNLKENDIETIIYEKVEPNPRSITVDEGAAIVRRESVNLLIGLGGGSAMDTTKGIALASKGGAPIWDYMTKKANFIGAIHPIIQVPTMAGTGSEINNSAVITNWDTHVKGSLGDPHLFAKIAIIDPELTLTVPLHQTKAGGFDTFAHLAEYYLVDGNPKPLTDGIRETCMKMVVKYLPQVIAHPDDLEARTQLSWASTIALSQFAKLGAGGGIMQMTCHGIEHGLSGYYDVTHGDGLAALFPAWMRSFCSLRESRFKALAKNVFGKEDGIKSIEEFLESVGMRLRLRDLGCKLEDADKIADLAIESAFWLVNHPTPLDKKAIEKIYTDSY